MNPAYYKEELHYGEYLKRLKKYSNTFMYTFDAFCNLLPVKFRTHATELYRMVPSHEFTLYSLDFCQNVEEVAQFKADFINLVDRVAQSKLDWYFG
jgi:hypothetical protein